MQGKWTNYMYARAGKGCPGPGRRGLVAPARLAALLLLLVVLPSGCATYHPMPLDEKAVDAGLSPPDPHVLRARISEIRHPLIRPVPFDLGDGLSPDEAAVFAVVANPGLRAARDREKIADAQLLQAGILPDPQLSASLEIPTDGQTQGTVNAFGIQPGWEITALISRGARIRSARSKRRSVDLAVAWQEWQVAEAARLHWFRLAWLKKRLALLDEAEKGLRKNLAAVRRAVALGVKTAPDLAAAEAAWQQVRISLSAAEQERGQEMVALNRALGLPPDRDLSLQEGVDLADWPGPLSRRQMLSGLERRRLDLLALKKGYQSQEERLRAAILSQFPKIGIGLVHARDTGDVITTGLAVTMDIPLFDRNQGRIALERATRKELFDEYTARLFAARSEVTAIMKKMEGVRKQMAVTREAVDARKRLVETYQKAVNQGNVDVLSYYQAWNDLIGKRMELLGLGETLTDLGVALEAASGCHFPAQWADKCSGSAG